MKLNVHEIEEAPKRLVYDQPLTSLEERLVHGARDFEFLHSAKIKLDYYRSGEELFFNGRVDVPVVGHCGRCTENYDFEINTGFHNVLFPRPAIGTPVVAEADEVGLSYYEGDIVDIGPMADDPIILALPTRPLCSEDCKGLCPNCGINLNEAGCTCKEASRDSPLAALRDLKVGR